ncbi:phage replisome organizer N-terminal domain-containing protein [Cetobacterium sp.]|uniref:phage replisome organizer N-terminal domain-containing protein n=1 Tax=Cetobacterium sp. TaxID=2071632 RepID=UPI003F2F04E8
MASAKKYFWLKLKEDFFRQKEVKKLRRIAGGDTFTIIYLKLQLLSMKTDGLLEYTGLEDNFAEELALEIDEDTDNVAVTLNFLTKCGLVEVIDDKEILLTKVPESIGKESESAERVRNHREKKKLLALQCNTSVTNSNTEIEIDTDIEKESDTKTIRQSIFELKMLLEKQFGKPLYPTDIDKIVLFSIQYNVNPLDIYINSDFLRGIAKKGKPTLRMWMVEETYKNMSQGGYINFKDVNKEKNLDGMLKGIV